MLEITLVKLIKASCLFHWVYANDTSYDDILTKPFWKNLTQLKLKDVEEILKFLNKWKCRLPYNCKHQLLSSLSQQIPRFVNSLQGLKLENVNLSQNTQNIINAYDTLNSVIKPTGTSKVLHLIIPDLFPMWDQKIAEAYGIKPNQRTGENYIKFMEKMQNILKKLINKINKNNPQQAIQKIKNSTFQGKYSLPKILDEYNYMKFTYNILGM